MYKLYLDKPEVFECEVSVKNASLKNSIARLVVESVDGPSLVFNGKIENGKCTVPIRRLKGILEENSKGKVHLEVVVEDTYFKPWSSDFEVEEHTSVKVKVTENVTPIKPSVTVKLASQPKKENPSLIAISELRKVCTKFGITKNTISRHREDFKSIIKEYFKDNPEFLSAKKTILSGLVLK